MEREREGEGGIKYAHRRPQVDQLLLSWVIDIKYGCFTLFFRNYEADAVWLSLHSILGRARKIREWEERTPLLFSHRASSTFPLSPWYVAELTVKWRSTDRLLSPMRTYCVLGYCVIFGPRIFFWLPRETDKSVLIKLHGKKQKKKWDCLLIQWHTYNM